MSDSLVKKRLYVGGLAKDVTENELRDRLAHFVHVSNLRLKNRTDEDGNHIKAFAHLDIEGTEESIKKCFTAYQNAKWKGSVMKLQDAKENFLDRLALERQEAKMSKETEVEKNKGKKKVEEWKPPDFKQIVGAPVPGTPIPGKKDWVVGKYGRVVPILNVKKSYKIKAIKHDPSKFCHAAKVFKDEAAVDDTLSKVDSDSLTWEVDVPDTNMTKKRKGQFSPPPVAKKITPFPSHLLAQTTENSYWTSRRGKDNKAYGGDKLMPAKFDSNGVAEEDGLEIVRFFGSTSVAKKDCQKPAARSRFDSDYESDGDDASGLKGDKVNSKLPSMIKSNNNEINVLNSNKLPKSPSKAGQNGSRVLLEGGEHKQTVNTKTQRKKEKWNEKSEPKALKRKKESSSSSDEGAEDNKNKISVKAPSKGIPVKRLRKNEKESDKSVDSNVLKSCDQTDDSEDEIYDTPSNSISKFTGIGSLITTDFKKYTNSNLKTTKGKDLNPKTEESSNESHDEEGESPSIDSSNSESDSSSENQADLSEQESNQCMEKTNNTNDPKVSSNSIPKFKGISSLITVKGDVKSDKKKIVKECESSSDSDASDIESGISKNNNDSDEDIESSGEDSSDSHAESGKDTSDSDDCEVKKKTPSSKKKSDDDSDNTSEDESDDTKEKKNDSDSSDHETSSDLSSSVSKSKGSFSTNESRDKTCKEKNSSSVVDPSKPDSTVEETTPKKKKKKKDKGDNSDLPAGDKSVAGDTTKQKNKSLSKHEQDNAKRLQAMQEQVQMRQRRKDQMKSALRNVGSASTKRIVFSSSEEEDDEKDDEKTTEDSLVTSTCDTVISGKEDNKKNDKSSFDLLGSSSDSSSEDENMKEMFQSKPQFEGKKGEKLMAMQKRFGDSRFKLDAKFMESDDSASEEEKEDGAMDIDTNSTLKLTKEEMSLVEEKKRNLQVLESVVGKNKVDKLNAKLKRDTIKMVDMTQVRFDPTKMKAPVPEKDKSKESKSSLQTLEKKRNVIEEESDSEDTVEEESSQEEETLKTEQSTSKSKVTLSDSLVDMLKSKTKQKDDNAMDTVNKGGTFSLLDMFDASKTNNDDEDESSEEESPAKLKFDKVEKSSERDKKVLTQADTMDTDEEERKQLEKVDTSKKLRKPVFEAFKNIHESEDESVEESDDDKDKTVESTSSTLISKRPRFDPVLEEDNALKDAGKVDVRFTKQEWLDRFSEIRHDLLMMCKKRYKDARRRKRVEDEHNRKKAMLKRAGKGVAWWKKK